MSPSLQIADALLTASAEALRNGSQYLFSRRSSEGYWWGELTADSTLESDFILLELWLHPPAGGVWNPPTRGRIDKAARAILARQLPDGGFPIYEKGPSEVSASIKAYTALKLAGLAFDDPNLARLRERILALGGLQAANSYVKINLSLFGLYPREHTPSVPPEGMLFGNLIYEMSSWTRAIVIPLSILHARNPQRPVPSGFTLDELLLPGVPLAFGNNDGFWSWRNFFLEIDRLLKLWERHGSRGIRMKAIRRAEQWTLARTRYSDGLGAIYPAMMYAVMALDELGYPADHPDMQEAVQQFMNLLVDDRRGFFFQPCFSPVWDTGIVAFALAEAGMLPEGALAATADWLLTKEVRRKGDWSVKRPGVEPSGWYFEFANEFYPDIDDTAMVLLALMHAKGSNPEAQAAAERRAVNWLLAMPLRHRHSTTRPVISGHVGSSIALWSANGT